ncbi:MAG: hypothetical protein QOJ40_139 [Verrucomicrobiota bacterium]
MDASTSAAPKKAPASILSADNPFGESCDYPDSQKWLIRSNAFEYYDGEE